MDLESELKSVLSHFAITGNLVETQELKRGHIHDTFVSAWSIGGESKRYVHQRMNNHVFRDIPALMTNISFVTDHIRNHLANAQSSGDTTLRIVRTKEGGLYYKTADGGFWRTYDFVEETSTYYVCESPNMAYEAAGACGRFLRYLVDLEPGKLSETIPQFMDAAHRFEQFEEAVKSAEASRMKLCLPEVEFAQSQSFLGSVINEALDSGEIPLRVTHNDTKLNNVLFHRGTEEAFCIVDLDTCMPGSPLFDYGDLVRNTAIPVDEDEKDLTKVVFDKALFDGVAKGFVGEFGAYLNDKEFELMIVAPRLLALTLGVRFLGDFLLGDIYFKVQYPEHNLVRARAQFQVARVMEENADCMQGQLDQWRTRTVA